MLHYEELRSPRARLGPALRAVARRHGLRLADVGRTDGWLRPIWYPGVPTLSTNLEELEFGVDMLNSILCLSEIKECPIWRLTRVIRSNFLSSHVCLNAKKVPKSEPKQVS